MLTPQEELQARVLKMYGQREASLNPVGQLFVQRTREAAERTVDRKVAAFDAEVFELMTYSKKV